MSHQKTPSHVARNGSGRTSRFVVRQESGFTIVETIVGVAMIAIAMAIALIVFIQATGTSERYVETTSNQAALTNAITKITHSLSVSPTLIEATDYSVEFTDSAGETVRYMYLQPSNSAHAQYMQRFKTVAGPTFEYAQKPRALPKDKGQQYLVEIRTVNGKAVFTVLASGVSTEQHKTGMPLFTYYDKENSVLTSPVGKDDLNRVTRSAVRVVSATSTRAETNAMELGTSIAFTGTRFGKEVQPGNTAPNLAPPGRPVLQGTLPPRTQNATLTFPLVAGANSYILYRDGNQIATLGESQNSYVDKSRPWGTDQTYHVVASGPGGFSPESNKLLLRTVPDRPAFINVNTKAAGAGHTVARDLTNHLAWTPENGAVGYKLYRGSELIYKGSATTFADTGRNYGDVTSYTVIAYNDVVNGSGGDSFVSAAVSLVSPPPAPVLTAGHSKGVRNLSWTASVNALKYDLDRTTPSAAAMYDGTARTYSDSQEINAATFTYRVRASNDAGFSPWSSASVNPRPGPVSLSGKDWDDGAVGDKALGGGNYLDWNSVTNATEYNITGGGYGTGMTIAATSNVNSTIAYGSTTTYTVAACNITGCGGASTITLKQAPGPFAVSAVKQSKRAGFYDPDASKGGKNWGQQPLTEQELEVTWGGSAGATGYQIRNGGDQVVRGNTSSRTYTTNDVTPGGAYSYYAIATAPNGTQRSSAESRVHMAPAAPKEINYTPQSTNGNLSRAKYWASSYTPVQGTADGGLQYRMFTVKSRDSDDWTDYYYNTPHANSRNGWNAWNGTNYSSTYDKRDAAGGWMVGSVMFVRSVDSVPANSWGGVSFTTDPMAWTPPGTSDQWEANIPRSDNQAPNTSFVMYMKARTGLSSDWTGSYDGSWRDVHYSDPNYPNSYDTLNQFKAR